MIEIKRSEGTEEIASFYACVLLLRFEQIVAGILKLKGEKNQRLKVVSERHPLISPLTPSAFFRAI